MAAYDQHHFVPRFLLEAWRSAPDGRLSTFHWDYHKNLRHGRHSPKGVAKLFQLYSLKTPADANWIEREFMGPHVDDPGAVAYHAIMNLGVDKLSPVQVDAWTRFLVSLMVRGPDMVALARARGGDVLRQSLAERPDEYLAARGNDPAKTLLEFVENNRPDIFHDIAPRILPVVVNKDVASLHAASFTDSGSARSGLSQTSSFNFQSLVAPDQRSGQRCLAAS